MSWCSYTGGNLYKIQKEIYFLRYLMQHIINETTDKVRKSSVYVQDSFYI